MLLHGDMDQIERNKVITSFKKKEISIMVATDVAGKIHSHGYHSRWNSLPLTMVQSEVKVFLGVAPRTSCWNKLTNQVTRASILEDSNNPTKTLVLKMAKIIFDR